VKKDQRILVISDVHANLTALEAVLAEAGDVNETWCLGDTVGYGPDPNECVERIRKLPNLTCMMGNHDLASSDGLGLEAFNMDARNSLQWQKSALDEENTQFLRSLPQTAEVRGEATLAHGSPRDSIWEYILNTLVARLNFSMIETPWCFVGHSHFQVIFQYHNELDDIDILIPDPGSQIKMEDRAIINPGSVGQPRDRNPQAAFGFYYPGKAVWEPRRVDYDITAVQKRIRDSGLPSRHADRLSGGW
jgi:diadenosine tetraphosphatase ApaH/serine/threonine PP2A family protein phosphatase